MNFNITIQEHEKIHNPMFPYPYFFYLDPYGTASEVSETGTTMSKEKDMSVSNIKKHIRSNWKQTLISVFREIRYSHKSLAIMFHWAVRVCHKHKNALILTSWSCCSQAKTVDVKSSDDKQQTVFNRKQQYTVDP